MDCNPEKRQIVSRLKISAAGVWLAQEGHRYYRQVTPLGFLAGPPVRRFAQHGAAADAHGAPVCVLGASGAARLRYSLCEEGYWPN
jgi:hypothetical protein